MADLAGRLKERLPGIHVISPRADGEFCNGAYLCGSAHKREDLDLAWLRRQPEWAAHWTGVVFCDRMGSQTQTYTTGWGDNGLQVCPFLFFGDAELIARIRDALR